MNYCLLVASGLVMNLIGPFKNKAEAKKWADAQSMKEYVIIPILLAGELEDG